MKKTFALRPEGKHPDRVLEAIKHEVRKYVKRERRRDVPKDMDFWDFDCKFGTTEATAQTVFMNEIIGLMDAVAKEQGAQFYVEILARAAKRKPRDTAPEPEFG